MSTAIKEQIMYVLTGTTLMVTAFLLLLKENASKNDLLTLKASERILSIEKEPLDRVIQKYRSAYQTPDELIPNRVMATLDSLQQKSTSIAIGLDKTREQITALKYVIPAMVVIIVIIFLFGCLCFVSVLSYY